VLIAEARIDTRAHDWLQSATDLVPLQSGLSDTGLAAAAAGDTAVGRSAEPWPRSGAPQVALATPAAATPGGAPSYTPSVLPIVPGPGPTFPPPIAPVSVAVEAAGAAATPEGRAPIRVKLGPAATPPLVAALRVSALFRLVCC
jgi:hypothetical protein